MHFYNVVNNLTLQPSESTNRTRISSIMRLDLLLHAVVHDGLFQLSCCVFCACIYEKFCRILYALWTIAGPILEWAWLHFVALQMLSVVLGI